MRAIDKGPSSSTKFDSATKAKPPASNSSGRMMVVDPEMQKPLKDNNDLERATTTTTTTTGTTTEVLSMQKKTGFDGLSFSDVGFRVLCLLAVQNCSKNLLMRYVMQDKPKFLTSAAVIAVGALKLVMSAMYIVCGEGKTPESIFVFLKKDWKTSLLLMVPAMAYTVQMMLEYVAMAHIDAALFAVVVQVKMLFTAVFAVIIMNRVLRKNEILSLCLLTLGVMCCNYKEVKFKDTSSTQWAETVIGLSATLGIATSSGFASVYTEKVIKSHKNKVRQSGGKVIDSFSLAYMQVQLASVSLVVIGIYASIKDYKAIMEHGLWQDFNTAAMISVVNSALGGLLVAVVLKFADSVLKGYATAISVVLTGIFSMIIFGTELDFMFFVGVLGVISAVWLYNANELKFF